MEDVVRSRFSLELVGRVEYIGSVSRRHCGLRIETSGGWLANLRHSRHLRSLAGWWNALSARRKIFDACGTRNAPFVMQGTRFDRRVFYHIPEAK